MTSCPQRFHGLLPTGSTAAEVCLAGHESQDVYLGPLRVVPIRRHQLPNLFLSCYLIHSLKLQTNGQML